MTLYAHAKKGHRMPLSFSKSLFDNPERVADLQSAATRLGVTMNEVRGAWMAWLKFRHDVDLDSVTPENLAEQPDTRRVRIQHADFMMAGPGFTEAFAAVGWLEITPDGFVLSSFQAREWRAKELAEKAKRRENHKVELERQKAAAEKKSAAAASGQLTDKDARRAERQAAYTAKTGRPATQPGPRASKPVAEPKRALTIAEIRQAAKKPEGQVQS